MKAKYGNVKTEVDGRIFDSKREAIVYKSLRILENAGMITDLKCQVPFELLPAQYESIQIQGKRKMLTKKKCVEKSLVYNADFTYLENDQLVVCDVKGKLTVEYRIKRKLMLHFHKIKIKEVK